MVKVKYIGDVRNGLIRTSFGVFRFQPGDVQDVDEASAKQLTSGKSYIIVEEKKVKMDKKIEVNEFKRIKTKIEEDE